MIAIGNDHGGLTLKKDILKLLQDMGLPYTDFGVNDEKSVDYPCYGAMVARAVADGRCDRGIVICGTGIGISIAANKVRGVRCALCHEPVSAALSREHNDANVIALGARVTGPALAVACVHAFLTTDFAGGRHKARLEQIGLIEDEEGAGCR